MIRIITILSFIVFLMSQNISSAQEKSVNSEEVVFGCLREAIPMVYKDASTRLQKKINSMIAVDIKSYRKDYDCDTKNKNEWYCKESKGRVFIGLDGDGKKMKSALACFSEDLDSRQTFYSREYLYPYSCLHVNWEYDEPNIYLLAKD